jgi:hypothetical protein
MIDCTNTERVSDVSALPAYADSQQPLFALISWFSWTGRPDLESARIVRRRLAQA